MSTEFIIGTIIGLIGIIPVVIKIVKWVKKPKLSELIKKLVDNSLSTNDHRKVLKRMNLILLRSGKRVSRGLSPRYTNTVKTGGPSLDEVLKAGFGLADGHNEDYSIFGTGKGDLQKLYIQSVLNSTNSGRTIHVSRWVTSGDWSQDDEEMTITIP